MINHYGAFTLDVKLVLNKNLGGIFQNFWQFQKKKISDLVQQIIVWDQ
jgi:hypothetical protein